MLWRNSGEETSYLEANKFDIHHEEVHITLVSISLETKSLLKWIHLPHSFKAFL